MELRLRVDRLSLFPPDPSEQRVQTPDGTRQFVPATWKYKPCTKVSRHTDGQSNQQNDLCTLIRRGLLRQQQDRTSQQACNSWTLNSGNEIGDSHGSIFEPPIKRRSEQQDACSHVRECNAAWTRIHADENQTSQTNGIEYSP